MYYIVEIDFASLSLMADVCFYISGHLQQVHLETCPSQEALHRTHGSACVSCKYKCLSDCVYLLWPKKHYFFPL